MKRRLIKTTAILAGAVLALSSCGSPASESEEPAPDDTAEEVGGEETDGDEGEAGDG